MTIVKTYEAKSGKLFIEEDSIVNHMIRFYVKSVSTKMYIFKQFDNIVDAEKFFDGCVQTMNNIDVIDTYTQGLGNYKYDSDNRGLSEDNYQDVAFDLIDMLEKK